MGVSYCKMQICGIPMEKELLKVWVNAASTEEIKARLVQEYTTLLLLDSRYKEAIGQAWGVLPQEF